MFIWYLRVLLSVSPVLSSINYGDEWRANAARHSFSSMITWDSVYVRNGVIQEWGIFICNQISDENRIRSEDNLTFITNRRLHLKDILIPLAELHSVPAEEGDCRRKDLLRRDEVCLHARFLQGYSGWKDTQRQRSFSMCPIFEANEIAFGMRLNSRKISSDIKVPEKRKPDRKW